jgi:hypothetical protein
MKRLFRVGVLLLLAGTAACTPVQRRAVGGTVTGFGAATTLLGGLMLVDPCEGRAPSEQEWCREHHDPANEHDASRVVAFGLGTMLLGGIVYLSGTRLPHPHAGPWHFHAGGTAAVSPAGAMAR